MIVLERMLNRNVFLTFVDSPFVNGGKLITLPNASSRHANCVCFSNNFKYLWIPEYVLRCFCFRMASASAFNSLYNSIAVTTLGFPSGWIRNFFGSLAV